MPAYIYGNVDVTDPALAVDDRVMQFLNQRALVAFESVDDDELPQRSGAVVCVARDQAGEVEKLTHAAWRRQGTRPRPGER